MWIFSDVDGTLLDDAGRCPLPAEALRAAASRHTIVLASSRTVPELRTVQGLLGWNGATIAEDGAVVVDQSGDVTRLGAPLAELEHRIRGTSRHAFVEELLRQHPEARRDRLASMLIPASHATPELREVLAGAGLALSPGGRWATITRGSDKGRAAGVLADRYGVTRWTAVGNAANDASLLARADAAFVIRNRDGHAAELATIPGAILLESPGPGGWMEMIDRIDHRVAEAPEEQRGAVDHHHPDDPGP